MPLDFTNQAFNFLDILGDTYQSRRIMAEIIGLLDDSEPAYSTYVERDNARRIEVVGHAIAYRYIRDLALIQVIEIEKL